jgi:hypothetical protein
LLHDSSVEDHMTRPDLPLTEASPPEKVVMLAEELLRDAGSNASIEDLAHLLGSALACAVVMRDGGTDMDRMVETVEAAEEAAFDFHLKFVSLADRHGLRPD